MKVRNSIRQNPRSAKQNGGFVQIPNSRSRLVFFGGLASAGLMPIVSSYGRQAATASELQLGLAVDLACSDDMP
jgi:hypothetical protein